jgi:rhamnosyltransferase
MIKIEKKNNKILFKEFLLKTIFQLSKNLVFKKIFLNITPKVYTIQEFFEKRFDRLILFSTYNVDGKVTKNLEFYLKKLYDLKSDIVLIDTSAISKNEEIEKIKPLLKTYIWRENIGYDFGSWKIGLLNEKDYKKYYQIIFTNDSVYGPIFPMDSIFHTMESKSLDVWGMTDSYEINYHLMSYFLVFQNKIIQSEEFYNFWSDLVYYPTRLKKLLIFDYEVGGTKYWKDKGYNLGAYVPYVKLNNNEMIDSRYYMNPTHVYWDKLIQEFRYPFIKRDLYKALIKYNQVDQLQNVIREYGEYKINIQDNN